MRRAIRSPAASQRGGISLLEVLISIFILSVGLLGLAVLIPIAQYQLLEAAKLDRGGALGRAAVNDLQVRGYLRPERWLEVTAWPLNASITNPPPSTTMLNPGTRGVSLNAPNLTLAFANPPASVPPVMPPFVIDPLAVSHPANRPPNQPTPPGKFPSDPYSFAQSPVLRRLTLDVSSQPAFYSGMNPIPMPFGMAERLFMSADDLVFLRPDDEALRSRPNFTRGPDGVWGQAGDETEAGWPGSDDRMMFAGDYSWMVTVSPDLTQLMTNALATRQFKVSVVIFHQRNFAVSATPVGGEPPPERMVLADLTGGGDVLLRTDRSARYLDLKAGDWLMLSAWMVDSRFDSAPDAGDGRRPGVGWYRVVSAGDDPQPPVGQQQGPPFERYVTLAGADWPTTMINSAGATVPAFDDADTTPPPDFPTVYATLVTGVVAVYEQSITLPGSSVWQ